MKLGFIGCGNMATAMIKGIIANKIVAAEDIMGSTKTENSLENIKKTLQIQGSMENKDVVRFADVIVLGVKPQFYASVIAEIREEVKDDQIIVSIAPGKTMEWLESQFQKSVKIVRTMPNTPALVGEGMTGVCYNQQMEEHEIEAVCHLFEGFGKYQIVEEHLMDAVVSVSGSSPAYVFLFIEAMADAAVADGMPRAKAYEFAAQAVLGSAKMVLESGKHPGELKDMVCSPGGTTIAAVRVLEEKGLRGTVMDAMKVCTEKAKGM